jgi:ribonuclease J
MIKEATEKIKEELKKYEEENVTEWSILKNAIKETTSKFLYEQTKRSPIILPIIMEV